MYFFLYLNFFFFIFVNKCGLRWVKYFDRDKWNIYLNRKNLGRNVDGNGIKIYFVSIDEVLLNLNRLEMKM